jgi:hypothetical protein
MLTGIDLRKVGRELIYSINFTASKTRHKTSQPMKKKNQIYTGIYRYVSPPHTLTDGEEPRRRLKVYTGSLLSVLTQIREDFDGWETFTDSFMPEVRAHFKIWKKADGNYVGNDYSAGQWFEIAPVIRGKSTVGIEM